MVLAEWTYPHFFGFSQFLLIQYFKKEVLSLFQSSKYVLWTFGN